MRSSRLSNFNFKNTTGSMNYSSPSKNETPKYSKLDKPLDNISFSGDNDKIIQKEDDFNKIDLQYPKDLSNLIDFSLNKSKELLRLDNITPIKSYINENSSTKNNGRNNNERYLDYEINISSTEGNFLELNNGNPTLNLENSPCNNSISGLNSFNLFNLSLQSPKNKISFLVKKIESYEIFIYDSFLFKRVVKENSLTKNELGQLYKSLTSPYLKTQILTELIGRLSKRHLKQSLAKLEEPENFEEYVVDLFNSFLGENEKSSNLFSKNLPGELNDVFGIGILLDLKKLISIPNLFIIMEYHNKIYFNDNFNINFNDRNPFIPQDIKYISPYLIEKVFNSLTAKNDLTDKITLTSLKRLPNSLSSSSPVLKEFHNNTDISRIELINSIYNYLPNKKYEICGKLCDYYLIKFSDTFFLNSMIYIVLAEIYYATLGIDAAKNFFEKSIQILKWMYQEDNCHLLCDAYYSYSLLLMKQGDDYIHYNFKEIDMIVNKALILGRDFYERNNREKFLKIKLNYYLFKTMYGQNKEFEDQLIWNNVLSDLEEIHSLCKLEGDAYVKIFTDLVERDRKKRGILLKLKKIIL